MVIQGDLVGGSKTTMCRQWIVLFLGIINSLVLVADGETVKNITIPNSAPYGYYVTHIPHSVPHCSIETNFQQFQDYFTHLSDGSIVTKGDLTKLNGSEIPVIVNSIGNHLFLNLHIQELHAVFHQESYIGTIYENENIGSIVHVVGHVSLFNSNNATYRLVTGEEFFNLETDYYGEASHNNKLVSKQSLDREKQSLYKVRIEALMGNGQTAESVIEVHVIDVNDNAPYFTQPSLIVPTTSDQSWGTVTILTASDIDLDDTLRYSLDDESEFYIDPDTGDLYSVEDILKPGHYYVNVIATDKAWHESKPLQVHISVQSDTLKFKSQNSHHISKRAITTISKTFEIVENRTSYSSLFSVASVQPRPISSTEVYELVSQSVNLFRPPDINGNVYLRAGERLDYENPSHRNIELVFNRTNLNMPNDFTLVEVTLKVQDLNDEKPMFKNKPAPFLATVPTNPAMGETVYTLLAEDPDQNSKLKYNLESGGEGKFRMVTEQDPSTQEMVGKIETTVSGPGQFLQGREYTLVVSAQDEAAGSTQKSDFTLVKVLVGFRPPQLFEIKFQGKVLENSGSGSRVQGGDDSFLIIRAKCFQDVLENKVLYELTESDGKISSLFSINSQGYVETLQNFDYEEKPNQYMVNVTATEIETGLSSSSQLVVDVMDVNDNSPTFQLSTYTFLLPEDTPIGGPAIAPQVTATDRDSGINGELEYVVSNDNFTIQTTIINNQYIGQIKVNKKLDYDYITDHQYRFNVTVYDKGSIPRSGLATVIIYVTNVNDEAPVFGIGSDHLYASISEEQIVGSVVTIIQATDPDGDNVEYYFTPKLIDRPPFRIDPASGLITLTTPLPEFVPYYTLNITAYDDGSCCDSNRELSSNTYILVEIKDTNNNQPKFPNCNYEPKVLENEPIGTVVVKVTAVDDDRGDNGNISYSIITSSSQTTQFEVDPFTGEVVTAVRFDREAPQGDRGIAVTVKAADQGKPQSLDSHCTFWVRVGDVNDNEPTFDSPSYSTSISESSAVVGRRVFAVRATDKDQDRNAQIVYTLIDNPGDFFRIEQDTGIIYLNKALHGRDDVVLTVRAEDQGEIPLSAESSVTIRVTDRTNNPPTWMEDNYEREYLVQETAQLGHVIFSMRVYSNTPPPYDGMSFALIDSRENSVQRLGPFRIQQDGDMVTLILKGTLDYNVQNTYELRLRVTNQAQTPLSSEIRPTVKVKDMNNEPPEFEGLDPNLSNSYRGSVPENEPPGQSVLKIKAVDNDHDPPNNLVTYSIMEDKNNVYKHFSINSLTGVISTSSQFDREEQSVYFIKVKAVDGTNSDIPNYFPPNSPNSATAQVQVIIADKNDNPPYFVQDGWEIEVPEQRPDSAGRILTVLAKDKDEADQLAFTITEGNVGNVFGIKQKTGDIYVAKTLDYETPPTRYTLTIMVQDGRYENFTTVVINVTDVNDNAPEFSKNVYEIDDVIEETDPPLPDGQFLVQVFATDKDLSRQNMFRYHLSGDGTDLTDPIFTIEPFTGKIFLRKKLDRDLPNGREVFQFNVIVEDEPSTNRALSGYAYVKVRPKDINDNSPIFREEDLHGSVPEHSKADQSVMTVVATDFDAGDNGTVFYEIDRFGNPPADPNGNLLFKINDETGLIQTRIADSLDREKTAQYFVPIIAKDRGIDQKSSTATVTISVSDINDQVPEFVKKIYRISMSENQVAGPVVTVSATDKDIDENARLTYTLKESDRTFFSIETMPPNAGVLTVFQVVDYEKHKFFNLTVYVQDSNPDHKDVAYIEVTVEDYNDNAPKFIPHVKTIRHPENIPEGTSLWNCTAIDADYGVNAEFEYLIDRKTDEGRRFTVNSNCEVKIRRGLDGETLDREALEGLPSERYEVRILAVDKGYPRQTGTATLRILVDDVNDNAPEFVLPYPAMVMELLPPPQFVITFRAKDRDTPKYGAPFMFSLPPCEENPTCDTNGDLEFTMDFDPKGDRGNGTGTVTAMKTFYRDQKKFYYLPVIMSDMRDKNSFESKTGTSTLTIEIGDENNHPHSEGHKDIFVYKYDFKGVTDEIAIGNVYAADLDDWDVVDKYYYFHGPPHMVKYFRIDLENGQIYMNKDTPAGQYDFTAKVWDFRRFTTINATATVTVTVEEITDQAVYSSGSLRFTGMTAEEFITTQTSSTNEINPYARFQELLARKLNVPVQYVAIFSVMNGKNNEYTEIRYAAHGSPWYPASKLDGIVTLDKAEFEAAAGITITMVNVDMCLRELCEAGGCSNTIKVGDNPNYVNANGTSFIGVATTVEAVCGCKAQDFSSPPDCTPTYCYNGGHCVKDEWGDVSCIHCPAGFDGPRCQMTKHSFQDGFALFQPFSQCEDSTTSIEFVTEFENGLLFYNGPITELGRDDPTDFVALSLVDGYPSLQLDHGSGPVSLTLDGRDTIGQRYLQKLNDGRWHHIDIIRKGKDVTMIVDRCEMLNMDTLTDTIPDRSPCEVSGKTPGENFYLNMNTLLQLGGRYIEPGFPEDITMDRFKGCVRNLVHNGELYDLYTDQYSKGENHGNGCPDEELICGLVSPGGPKCGAQGICEMTDMINEQYKCTCKPGYRTSSLDSEACNIETTVRDLQLNSFMIWSLNPEFLNKDLHPRTTEVHVRFRTRDLDGILLHLPSNSDEFITLELVGGRVKVQYNLGGVSGAVSELSLYNAPASNGQWHTLTMRRIGKWFQLKMDGGEGRYYNETWGPDNGDQLISIKMYQIVSGGHVVFSNNPIVNGQDLNNTCITDIRLNNKWFPMINSENQYSEAAALELEQAVENDCVREDCLNVTCPTGNPISMVCFPLWGMHECRCPIGTYPNGYNCFEIDYCIQDEPCFDGATCVPKPYPDNFTCVCPVGWTGRVCNVLHSTIPASAGITTGFIIIIIICIFLVLVVALVVFLVVRYKQAYDPDRYILDVDPDDDIRENVINYNEEGAGEEDQEGYDIHRLRKPDDVDTALKHPYMYGRYQAGGDSGERPDIGNFIINRLADADNDPSAPPHDSVREFVNEGGGSDAGSLSSLNTGSSDNDHDYDYLNDWGPKFTKLATLYGGEEDDL